MEAIRYGIGIDMAMEKIDACISTIDLQQRVNVKACRTFLNTTSGYEQMFKWANKNCSLSIPVIYLMEATGIYYEGLASILQSHKCCVSVILLNKAKKYKQALGLRSKTDSIDSRSLSRMIWEQSLPQWKPMSKNIYLLR